jgi:hypothetical protein
MASEGSHGPVAFPIHASLSSQLTCAVGVAKVICLLVNRNRMNGCDVAVWTETIRPVTVSTGPIKEVIIRGEGVDQTECHGESQTAPMMSTCAMQTYRFRGRRFSRVGSKRPSG